MAKRVGMSLVEVVIAMSILAIALLAIAASFVSSTKLMAHTVDRERAVLLANQTLDYIEAQEIDDDQSDWGLSYGDLYDDFADKFDVPDAFSVSWNVTSDDDYSRTIDLNVSWNGVGPDDDVDMKREISSAGHVKVED